MQLINLPTLCVLDSQWALLTEHRITAGHRQGHCLGMAESSSKRRRVAAPPQGPVAGPNAKEQRRFMKWINSYAAVSKWMARYDLEKALNEGSGLTWLPDLLPDFVAQGFLRQLEGLQQWDDTAADEDYAQNNISHAFWSSKQGPRLEPLFRVLSMLSPGSLFTFSAGKYTAGRGHIAPHDDRAYTQVLMDDGQQVTCSRTIAVIYYLTQDWRSEYGGHLVDLGCGQPQHYVPQFNAAVAFRIPRFHEVTPVTAPRPRYSIFGWFLEPGQLYELHTGSEQTELQQPVQQQLQTEPNARQRVQRRRKEHKTHPGKLHSSDEQRRSSQAAAQAGRLRRLHPVHMKHAPPAPAGSIAGSAKLRKPVVLMQD